MGPGTQVEVCGVWDAASEVRPADLSVGVVHLWKRALPASAKGMESCFDLLSIEEREKALRYRIERPRAEFIVTRSTLRSLIARYLDTSAQEVSFGYTEFGRPVLNGLGALHFNVSHTDGLALMAFARDHEVGVDVEKFRPTSDIPGLADRFFSAQERDALKPLSGDDLLAAFFRCWTRKEAYIKAKGEGLSLPLHQFDVSLAPNDNDALLATRPDPSEVNRWTLCDVPIDPGYAAALAIGVKTT